MAEKWKREKQGQRGSYVWCLGNWMDCEEGKEMVNGGSFSSHHSNYLPSRLCIMLASFDVSLFFIFFFGLMSDIYFETFN